MLRDKLRSYEVRAAESNKAGTIFSPRLTSMLRKAGIRWIVAPIFMIAPTVCRVKSEQLFSTAFAFLLVASYFLQYQGVRMEGPFGTVIILGQVLGCSLTFDRP